MDLVGQLLSVRPDKDHGRGQSRNRTCTPSSQVVLNTASCIISRGESNSQIKVFELLKGDTFGPNQTAACIEKETGF